MKIGYARVSTDDQRLDLQLSALNKAGCSRIYRDHGFSGALMQRPGLKATLKALQPGQTLVVWRLDRLGRSLHGLVELVEKLGARGVEFQSITESIDTSSSGGRLVFHIMAALAEFERALISERTKAGMLAAQTKGQRLGRPMSLTEEQVDRAWYEVHCRKEPIDSVAERYGVSSRTLKRRFRERDQAGAA